MEHKDLGRAPSGQALIASDGAASVSALSGFDPSRCRVCGGGAWVCENHADRPWDGVSTRDDACGCGAGMPCGACNRDMACAGYPRWKPIASAPRDGTLILIAGGTYSYDAETFPTDRPFNGVAIGHWRSEEWSGGYGSEYDGEYWHKPDRWMRLPIPTDAIAIEARSDATGTGAAEGESAAIAQP